MGTFCLVHSSVQGPSGWSPLVRELTNAGHNAITPDLAGIDPSSPAAVYADAVAAAIEVVDPALDDPLWVVGHSAGGLFLPWMPNAIPERQIAGLIYLAAYAPLSGTSLLGSLAADPDMFNPDWIGKDPMQDSIAEYYLFHDCSPANLSWALSTRRVMIARAAMEEILPAGLTRGVGQYYIACKDDRTLSPSWMLAAARERCGRDAIQLKAGHCPHVSQPAILANTLIGLVVPD